jgi:5'-3' exonuclease
MNKKELLQLLDTIDAPVTNSPTFTKHSKILLIDGMNLFLRNFAMLNYVNQNAIHIGGLGGFLKSLGYLINLTQPTSVYVIFEGVGSTVNRKNLQSNYKSNRNNKTIINYDVHSSYEEETESKINQIIRLIQYLKCLPLITLSIDKTEADDIIAYLSKYFYKTYNSEICIASNDGDFMQLVNDKISIYRPIDKQFYTPKKVKDKFGIPPNNFIIYKSLLGDSSDNISGVKGLGPKQLIKKFPQLLENEISLSNIFEISEDKLTEHILYARILSEKDKLESNYKLMDLHNPFLDEKEKDTIHSLIDNYDKKLNIPQFVKMYEEDGLRNIITNPVYWLQDIFKILKNF